MTQTIKITENFTKLFSEGSATIKSIQENFQKHQADVNTTLKTIQSKLEGVVLALCSMEKIDLNTHSAILSPDFTELIITLKEVPEEPKKADKAVKVKM